MPPQLQNLSLLPSNTKTPSTKSKQNRSAIEICWDVGKETTPLNLTVEHAIRDKTTRIEVELYTVYRTLHKGVAKNIRLHIL